MAKYKRNVITDYKYASRKVFKEFLVKHEFIKENEELDDVAEVYDNNLIIKGKYTIVSLENAVNDLSYDVSRDCYYMWMYDCKYAIKSFGKPVSYMEFINGARAELPCSFVRITKQIIKKLKNILIKLF